VAGERKNPGLSVGTVDDWSVQSVGEMLSWSGGSSWSRHLDVTVGKVEVAGREPRRFAFAPKGADRPIDILRAALGAQGWRPGQRVTVISDGEAVLPNLVRAAIREPVPRTGPAARRRRIGSLCHLGRQRISFVVNDGIRQPNPIMSRTFPP
jgi:hypothetical protein